jgi:class 3 adenylate cyclase/tetratricopeptide (TPR) repeat protein
MTPPTLADARHAPHSEAQNPVVCADCAFDNPAGARFCAGCGQKLPAACAVCGQALVPGGRFCAGCGTPVDAVAGPETPRAEPAVDTPAQADSPPNVERAPPAPAAERRLVTILFADIVGSTTLGERVDPEDLAEIINGAFTVMNRAVSEAGGTIGRLMGDGILAFFGAPVSYEDDALRAIRAALAIQAGVAAYGRETAARGGPPLNVRIGLDSGLVIVGQVGSEIYSEYTTLGDAANTAARLQGAAAPGAIVVSAATARLIRGAVTLEAIGPLALKGKAAPVEAFQVTGPPPEIGLSVRGVPGLSTPLVGRAGERARLLAAFEDSVDAGRLGWITLTGDAGVGKSRLLAACLEAIAASDVAATVVRARSVEQASDAYEIVRKLLAARYGVGSGAAPAAARAALESGIARDLGGTVGLDSARAARDLARLVVPDPTAGDDPRGLAERALAALVALAVAWTRDAPLVLALEDLHWADDASLDAVARLAAGLAERPAFILGNARPTLFLRRPLWGEGEAGHLRLDLTPLSRAAVGRLVAALLDRDAPAPDEVIDRVALRSEGNPYYIEELVQMLVARGMLAWQSGGWRIDRARWEEDRVPSTLQGMLQARLDALDPAQKDALQRASVLGRVFWDGAVVALGAADAGIIDGLRAAGLVFARERSSFAGQQEFIFKHALLRDAAYATLLKRARPELHARAASWLLGSVGDRYGEFAAQVGRHCEAAGEIPAAAGHYRAAADRARAGYANADAIELYGQALALWPEEDTVGRFEGLRGRELALDLLGRRDAQRQDLDALAGLAAALPASALSYVHFRRSWLALRTGDPAVAEVEARAALAAAGEDPGARADACVSLGNALRNLRQYDEALVNFRAALALREQAGDQGGAAIALLGVASSSEDAGDIRVALDGYEQALSTFEAMDDLDSQAVTHTNLAVTLARQGDLHAAEPHFETALQLYRAVGNRVGEGKALHNLGYLASEEANFATAETHLREALAIFRSVAYRSDEISVLRDMVDVLHKAGRNEEAAELQVEAENLAGVAPGK